MVLKIERFQPEGMNVRMSGGKSSYSHVVTVSGSGKIVYTAGQLARDVDGNCVGKGDMRVGRLSGRHSDIHAFRLKPLDLKNHSALLVRFAPCGRD